VYSNELPSLNTFGYVELDQFTLFWRYPTADPTIIEMGVYKERPGYICIAWGGLTMGAGTDNICQTIEGGAVVVKDYYLKGYTSPTLDT
jgi:hypothetical protein